MDESFNIGLNYLRMPLNLYYNISVSNKSSIIISGGMSLRLLLLANDNFDNIVFEKIGLPHTYKRYQPIVWAYDAGVAYQYRLSPKHKLEIALYAGSDVNSMVKNNPQYPENFGFYANLHSATYSRYGISLRYFLIH